MTVVASTSSNNSLSQQKPVCKRDEIYKQKVEVGCFIYITVTTTASSVSSWDY